MKLGYLWLLGTQYTRGLSTTEDASNKWYSNKHWEGKSDAHAWSGHHGRNAFILIHSYCFAKNTRLKLVQSCIPCIRHQRQTIFKTSPFHLFTTAINHKKQRTTMMIHQHRYTMLKLLSVSFLILTTCTTLIDAGKRAVVRSCAG